MTLCHVTGIRRYGPNLTVEVEGAIMTGEGRTEEANLIEEEEDADKNFVMSVKTHIFAHLFSGRLGS